MSIANSINKRAWWKPGRKVMFVFAGIAIIASAAVAAVFLLRDDTQATAQTANQLEFQVQRGTITTSISIGGTSAYLDKEELTFGSIGTVGNVAVEVGDSVEVGDVIAELDAATVAALKVAEATAESALTAAQAVYDKANSGATARGDLAKAQEALALTELEVTAAQKSLFDVNAAEGADSELVAAARSALSFDERELEAALAKLAEVVAAEHLSDLAVDINEAESAYRDVLMRWFGAVPDGYEEMSLDDVLAGWGVTFEDIYTTFAKAHLKTSSPWIDNVETPWDDVLIWKWTSMSLNIVDTEALTSSSPSILAPRGEIEAVWTTLTKARDDYETEGESAKSAQLAAEQVVSKAEDVLELAQDGITDLLDPALLRVRQAALDAAVAKQDEAAISLEQVQAASEAAMNDAESKLELARQNVADARLALEYSVLVSPISGSVLSVGVEAGDVIQRATVIAEIADTSVIAVEATVDEEDILSIRVGLPASVSLDAVAGRAFAGTVTSIGQAEQSQQGAVSFPVVVTLDDTSGLSLVEGLTASAQVINSQVSDVLMVPVAAVTGSIFEPAVELVRAQGNRTVTVQLGSSNGTFVEVVSGLQENDTVVATIAGQIGLPTSTGNTFIPGGGGFGGRVPGGGGFGGGGRGQ